MIMTGRWILSVGRGCPAWGLAGREGSGPACPATRLGGTLTLQWQRRGAGSVRGVGSPGWCSGVLTYVSCVRPDLYIVPPIEKSKSTGSAAGREEERGKEISEERG